MQDPKDKAFLTTETTDTETGCENCAPEEELRRSLEALEALFRRGLIDEATYQLRRDELTRGQ